MNEVLLGLSICGSVGVIGTVGFIGWYVLERRKSE